MSLNILVSGELCRAPVRKTSRKGGRPLVTAALLCRPSEDSTMLIGVVAFGAAADVLEGSKIGDPIAASGPARPSRWRGNESENVALTMLAKQVLRMHPTRRSELEDAVDEDAERAATE